MTVFSLVKAGYGSIKEIQFLSVDDFLDLVEYENISGDIQYHLINRK
jgi:hypothetical protein